MCYATVVTARIIFFLLIKSDGIWSQSKLDYYFYNRKLRCRTRFEWIRSERNTIRWPSVKIFMLTFKCCWRSRRVGATISCGTEFLRDAFAFGTVPVWRLFAPGDMFRCGFRSGRFTFFYHDFSAVLLKFIRTQEFFTMAATINVWQSNKVQDKTLIFIGRQTKLNMRSGT